MRGRSTGARAGTALAAALVLVAVPPRQQRRVPRHLPIRSPEPTAPYRRKQASRPTGASSPSPSHRGGADLYLPHLPRSRRQREYDAGVPAVHVAVVVVVAQGRGTGHRLQPEHRRAPGLQQRQQDGDRAPVPGVEVVRRHAHNFQGPGFRLLAPGRGGQQDRRRQPGQLRRLHAWSLPDNVTSVATPNAAPSSSISTRATTRTSFSWRSWRYWSRCPSTLGPRPASAAPSSRSTT